jgi:Uma2 family endonuclease
MSLDTQPVTAQAIIYPDSDGQPMADNTLQLEWIFIIKGNLDWLFADREDVFVASDLLWYPVEGRPDIRRAPDALVAFGRPKGYRGSYIQHREDGVAPQVVFEILSPNNTLQEMAHKLVFYDRYGVEEYYLYDPDCNELSGWLRQGDRLLPIDQLDDWVSPRLGITFVPDERELRLFYPDGQRFLSFIELRAQADRSEAAHQEAEAARQEAEAARQEAEAARQQAEIGRQEAEAARQQAEQRAEQLAARLRALGIDPDV